MTATEKAKEFVNEFYKCMPFKDTKLTVCDESPKLIIEMEKLSAKQCASIAVGEIIKSYETNIGLGWSGAIHYDNIAYWNQVRKEIHGL